MNSKEKALPPVSNSSYSRFNSDIRRLNELGAEYLKAEPMWESDGLTIHRNVKDCCKAFQNSTWMEHWSGLL